MIIRGGRIVTSVDDFVGDFAANEALLAIFDIVKLDFQRISASRMPGIVTKLRQRKVLLVAEKVETPEQFELAKSLGFDLFQGYFFAGRAYAMYCAGAGSAEMPTPRPANRPRPPPTQKTMNSRPPTSYTVGTPSTAAPTSIDHNTLPVS